MHLDERTYITEIHILDRRYKEVRRGAIDDAT